MPGVHDTWAAGSAYESFMGRWSRQLATSFVSWIDLPGGAHWLDVGCGTGALADAICRMAEPASVLGCDPAGPFVDYARKHTPGPCVSFVVAGSGSLPARRDGYDCVASLLALNFFPAPVAAIREMASLAAARATVTACVWDYADGMQFLRRFWDVATALDPAARELDEGERFPVCRPEALLEVFRTGGLADVRCEAIEITTEFASFDDYWQPLLGGTGPVPSYVASLDVDRRATLAGRLAEALHADGGPIALTARAWAARGTVSGGFFE